MPVNAAACCAPASEKYFEHAFEAMGTVNRVIFRADSLRAGAAIKLDTSAWISRFESRFSKYRADSIVSLINREAGSGWVEVDSEVLDLLGICDWLNWKTGGLFDPSAGPLLGLWDYHVKRESEPSAAEINSALALVGWRKVLRRNSSVRFAKSGMSIDLGGIGKEYAIDRIARMLDDRGVQSYLVDFGHDVRVKGSPPEGGPWRIGLEIPDKPGFCWNGVALRDVSMCCSGNYQRYSQIGGRRFGHIVDPRVGLPVNNENKSVWVVGGTCTEAGAVARAAFIAGPQEGMDMIRNNFPSIGCIATQRGYEMTEGFNECLIETK